VLPGLIDAHTHITSIQTLATLRCDFRAREALIGARNAGSRSKPVLRLSATWALAASATSPCAMHQCRGRTWTADAGQRPALSITGGHCDNNLLPFDYHAQEEGVADGVEAVQHKTREIIK